MNPPPRLRVTGRRQGDRAGQQDRLWRLSAAVLPARNRGRGGGTGQAGAAGEIDPRPAPKVLWRKGGEACGQGEQVGLVRRGQRKGAAWRTRQRRRREPLTRHPRARAGCRGWAKHQQKQHLPPLAPWNSVPDTAWLPCMCRTRPRLLPPTACHLGQLLGLSPVVRPLARPPAAGSALYPPVSLRPSPRPSLRRPRWCCSMKTSWQSWAPCSR